MRHPASLTALFAIWLYRRYLSRLKGYRCAHHSVHGEGTCSAYGRKVFTEHDPLTALRMLGTRLRECRQTYLSLVAHMTPRQHEAHWKARGFLLPPYEMWKQRWTGRNTVR